MYANHYYKILKLIRINENIHECHLYKDHSQRLDVLNFQFKSDFHTLLNIEFDITMALYFSE